MANTYTLAAVNVTFAANKTLAAVFNQVGSSNIVKIYRVWVLNNQINAVVGVLTNLELHKISDNSGGTTLTPVKHNTANPTLSTVDFATNSTVVRNGLLTRVLWSTDEPTANTTVTLDELQTLPPLTNIWSTGYADSVAQPLTLNAGEGIALINTGAIVGQCDVFIQMTVT